jgi:membrane associated rhomboid family serine protease
MRFSPTGPRRRAGLPRITPAAAWILGITVGCFLVYLFLDKGTRAGLERWLVLTPASLAEGHVWKLLSTVLMPQSPLAFFFDALMLWMFVPQLEKWWGTKRFLTFFVVTSVVGFLLGALVGLLLGGTYRAAPIVGLSPFIYASIAAYGVVYANQPVQFFGVVPIKAKALAIGMAAFVLLFVVLQRDWTSGAAFFGAMATAVLMTSGRVSPKLWWLRFKRWKLRRKYTVLDGGAGTSPGRPNEKRWLN